jgi:cell division septation protein DedD
MALKMYDSTYNLVNADAGTSDQRYLPSPAALSRIESMLDAIDDGCGGTDREYVEAVRNRLSSIGTAAENELINSVLEDMNENKETISSLGDDVVDAPATPSDSSDEGDNEDATENETFTGPEDLVDVPADEPDHMTPAEDAYDFTNLPDEVEDTSSDNLTAEEINGWTDEELNDRIAALSSLGDNSPQSQNLAAMEEALNNRLNQQTQTPVTQVVSNTPETQTTQEESETSSSGEEESQADARAREIDSSFGASGSISLIDNALANMTDFFHTDKDTEEDKENASTGIFDPLTSRELSEEEVDSMDIMDNFDTELVQGGQDEAVSERNISD